MLYVDGRRNVTSVGPDWAVCWLVANCTNNQQGLPLTCANLPPLSLIQVDDQNTLEKLIISISPRPAHTFPPQQSLGKR